ncbi:MAG: DUF502 domain-containing protein [Defluviicoccus sp.]|nr:DUF502 domain-containing protein [Defluviicoccus sp.]MDG4610171.1 DUF502 domain-containing protein [Defluviicoccus sp.]
MTSTEEAPPAQPQPAIAATPHRLPIRLSARLRAYFLAGVLVVAPISITFYLAWLLISFVDNRVTPLIPARFNPETYLPFAIPGVGLIIGVIFLTLVGMLTAGFFGRLFMRASEAVMVRTPFLRGIYGAVKQIVETVLAQQSAAFREAVLIEYPRRGIWAIGFLTGRTEGEVQYKTKEDVLNVFLPTTPNPTSGFLLFVPRAEVVPLTMSVEGALKMVISGGILTPPVVDDASSVDDASAEPSKRLPSPVPEAAHPERM